MPHNIKEDYTIKLYEPINLKEKDVELLNKRK